MSQIRYEKHYEAQDSKLSVDFVTDFGQYHAAHWQEELEMIYILNGTARIVLDGETITVVPGDFIVIDSNHVFDVQCRETFMQIRVHVDKEFLSTRAGSPVGEGQIAWTYYCRREELREDQLEPFLKICDLFKQLVPLYINEPAGYRLKTESIILDILYQLVRHFSLPLHESDLAELSQDKDRIRRILKYIEEHYAEPLSLAGISEEFGLSREYFSRMFHKSVGMTLSEHVNRVRISHFYHDLVTSDTPVMELLEKNGLTNYKLFIRTFKEIYGHSPRTIRKMIV